MMAHGSGPGVVGCQGQLFAPAVSVQKLSEIRDAAPNVLFRVVRVEDAQIRGGLGHQLHQSHCAFAGPRVWVEP